MEAGYGGRLWRPVLILEFARLVQQSLGTSALFLSCVFVIMILILSYNIRPCRFDLSVCLTWSGQKKKSLENIKKKEKLISTTSTAFKCLYGLYRLL
jgi:hypothetical protein